MRKRHNHSQMAATRSPLATDLYITLDKQGPETPDGQRWIRENKLG